MASFVAVRVLSVFLLFLTLLLSTGCDRAKGEGVGLLAGRAPTRAVGVQKAERLTDGLVPRVGGFWNSNRTTVFESRQRFVEYDLGQVKPIVAVALLADNNDVYELLGSLDGKKFQRIWAAPRVSQLGMRWRQRQGLEKEARYLRLSPRSGDASLSVAELSVFSTDPGVLPPKLKTVKEEDVALRMRSSLLVCGSLLVLASTFLVPGGSLLANGLLLLLALGGVLYAGFGFSEAYPVAKLEVSLTRAVAAFTALLVIARQTFSSKKFPSFRSAQVGILGLLGLVSVAAFYNLGTHQFFDQKNAVPSHVHNYDMRVYFPVAKYFDELKYDGLYLGSMAAYAEEHGGVEHPSIQRAELRDLRDHRMRRVSTITPEVKAIKSRFSEKRWAEFKTDMRYFWETMGSGGYLGSMADHGGNATPVWLSVAYLMYGKVQAGNEILLWGAMLDPLLLLLFAVCVARSFGAATAAVSLVIFGANDFYMFGSNWAGATLRNDWMVYLGLGACALKTERYKLGGALLAMSALIRAFPAIALLSLGVPVAHALLVDFREKKKLPSAKAFLKEHRWFVDAAMGATLCVVISVIGSSMVLGWDAWPLWVKKISSFTASPHVNHISLLTVVAGSQGHQAEVLAQRSLVFWGAAAVYFGLAIWIAARSRPHQVALLGIMMMPIIMYPANYYIHFIFLLPLLVDEVALIKNRFSREAAGKVWMALLGICAAQYFTVRETDLANHFYNASVILMVGLMAVLVALLPRDAEGRVDFARLPFVSR